jgi:hypothetical protein
MTMMATAACWQALGDAVRACSGDENCSEGRVCREARCTVPCHEGHWVGERVAVRTAAQRREGVITACEQGYWVRYESGIEEQVDEERLRSTTTVQAR